MSWIDNSPTIPTWNLSGNIYPSRQLNRTYIQGFLDVSGGNILLRNGGLFTQTDISSNGNLYTNNAYINGNLAIGKNTTGFSLDVSGIINSSALYVNGSPYIGSQWTTISANIYYITGNVAIGKSTDALYTLDVNGNIFATGNILSSGIISAVSFNATSDYRIKENPIQLSTNIHHFNVDNLNPLSYTNKQLKRQDLGFIAHEVQQYYPFLVNGVKDDADPITGMPIYQSINYNGIIPILVAECKLLKIQIKHLQEQIDKILTS